MDSGKPENRWKQNMNNVSFVMYSHSTYSDLWEPFFDRAEQHINLSFAKYYLFVDSIDVPPSQHIPEKYEIILYDDTDSYTDRLTSCLQKIETEYCIFQHEDMILYDDINATTVKKILHIAEKEKIDYIKLLKGGSPKDTHSDLSHKECTALREIYATFDYIIAIQSSIWKVKAFLEIVSANPDQSIWQFELSAQEYCRTKNYSCFYSFEGNEKKRGLFHWDSSVWPVIATAIFKGKWTVDQYPQELKEIFIQYAIDPADRGTC